MATIRKPPARKPVTKVAAAKPMPRRPLARKAPAKPVRKPPTVAKADAVASESVIRKKIKMIRDSFSFPAHEHALLRDMKERALKLGKEFKKSEILRAGIVHLANMADRSLVAALAKVERVKTGRPGKKQKRKKKYV